MLLEFLDKKIFFVKIHVLYLFEGEFLKIDETEIFPAQVTVFKPAHRLANRLFFFFDFFVFL